MTTSPLRHFFHSRKARALATSLVAAASVVGTAVLVAPNAQAASGEYTCRVLSAPASVKIGTTFRVTYTYYKSSGVKSANWSPANTNPVMSIRNNSTGVYQDAAYNTGATYYVRPGGGVALTFSRGTSTQAAGVHVLRGVMYKASNGSTTSLMSGVPCSHKVNFYR